MSHCYQRLPPPSMTLTRFATAAHSLHTAGLLRGGVKEGVRAAPG